MIITQFCRGTFMENSLSATDDFESLGKSNPVNSQASLFITREKKTHYLV